jgi:hypothetical protein
VEAVRRLEAKLGARLVNRATPSIALDPSQTDDIMTAKMIIDATRSVRLPFATRLDVPAEVRARFPIEKYFKLGDGRNHYGVDTTLQIRLFRKLKLTKCARAGDRAGLFCVTCRGAIRIRAPASKQRCFCP